VPYVAQEWLNIALRWTHVFAAIMWVGQTYFFTWLDHTFHHERQVWMVHSGGFYVVDKQKEPKSCSTRPCTGSSGRRPSPG